MKRTLALLLTLASVSSFAGVEDKIETGEYRGTTLYTQEPCTVLVDEVYVGNGTKREISVYKGVEKPNPYYPEYLEGNTTQLDSHTVYVENEDDSFFTFLIKLNDDGFIQSVEHKNARSYTLDVTCEKLELLKY